MLMNKQRILVVDDDRDIVRLLQGYLEQASFAVQVAYDGGTALQQVRHNPPDLVLLDLMLPDRDGWDIIRTLRSDEELAHLPIIMLTARVDDMDKILGLELGADDYVTKPFNPREVVARVRAVLRRMQQMGDPAGNTLFQVGSLSLDVARHVVKVKGNEVELTPTEFDLLHIFMETPGYVFTRDELIERGLGYTYAGLGRTLDSHIKNLRRKIEPNPKQPTLIQTVYGRGYRLMEDAG